MHSVLYFVLIFLFALVTPIKWVSRTPQTSVHRCAIYSSTHMYMHSAFSVGDINTKGASCERLREMGGACYTSV
jgi:hypothetical protein